MGHYGEPNLEIAYKAGDSKILYLLQYNTVTGEWKTTRQGGSPEVIDITQGDVEMEDSAHFIRISPLSSP